MSEQTETEDSTGELRITNTLSGEKEVFEPIEEGEVKMYVCGLTVSDAPHLGHARVWVVYDFVHRYLEYKGYDVTHVENVTDIDDKIITKSNEEGVSAAEIATRYSQMVYDGMKDLNVKRVNVRPRVTQHVDDIIEMVEDLIENGYAYESGGDVYFDVSEFEGYGELSNQKLEELEEQGEESDKKEDPADFALWKAAKPNEPSWDSPWGEGRPGWHIECSTMSTAHLGETIDIHGGGNDLVFPHHENEIAQTEAATGEKFARYWMHNGMLKTEGEKMSTSLDNFWTLEDALREYTPNELRMFYAGAHYRGPQALTKDALDEGRKRWERLENAVRACEDAMDSQRSSSKKDDDDLAKAVNKAVREFEEAMDDDFNTPEALAALFDLAGEVNRHVENSKEYDYPNLFRAWKTFVELGGDVLGFDFSEKGGEGISDDLVELLLEIREEERKKGNYEVADEIRDRLAELGVEVEDTDDGATYRFE